MLDGREATSSSSFGMLENEREMWHCEMSKRGGFVAESCSMASFPLSFSIETLTHISLLVLLE